jgi:translation initiation factor IF-2
MPETTKILPRLLAAASEFNVGKDTIVELLIKKGLLEVSDAKPTLKLTNEMYDACQQEFLSDKQAKAKSNALDMPVYKKAKTEELVVVKAPIVTEELPVEVKVETPVVEVVLPKVEAPEAKPIVEVAIPTPEVKEVETVTKTKVIETTPAEANEDKASAEGQGLKVLGTIDLSTIDSSTKPKKIAKKPKDAALAALEAKPKPAKAVEEKETKKAAKPIEEFIEKAPLEIINEVPEEAQIENIVVQRIEGPKVLGKIELPINSDTRPKPMSSKDKRKRKRIPVDAKGNTSSPQARTATPGTTPGAAPTGGGGRFKATLRDPNAPPTPPGGGNRGGARGGRDNNRGGNRGGGSATSKDVKEIDKKEIQDKIRQTQAKLAGNSGKGKSAKAKYRKQKRDGLSDQMGDETPESTLQVTEFISVAELASLMDVSFAEVIGKCMGLGIMVSINQRLDAEVIELVASEFGFDIEFIDMEQAAEIEDEDEEDDTENLKPRSPIVTIMGHVDHGKTSLLDYIRNATVVAGEAGGITQHVGAYEVKLENGKSITFLDTPGHEAFTAMRARGAKVTDIAVIVVAADDAVMPQTKEAISHAQAAGVPMIFAINKMDKDGANPEKIYEQLSQMNILVEAWGGKFQQQEISAKKGLNINELLDKILLEAEMLDLKANPDREATGSIIEASLDKGRGYVATILVQNGTLKKGDLIVSGQFFGRVKAMFNERQNTMGKAGPSKPAVVLGLSGAPQAGEKFKIYTDETEAREIATKRAQILREQGIRTKKHITLDEIGRRLALGSFKELKLIIKGDVDGSVEALTDSMQKLSTQEILVSVIHKGVGQINESDVVLAEASDAIIIGFNVRPSAQANKLAEGSGIQIRSYSIIYKAIDEIKQAMEGLLEPTVEEKIISRITIREVFKFDKATVAGCYVTEGKANRSAFLRVIRDGIVIFPNSNSNTKGEFAGLRRHKDDVKEVNFGYECGVTIKGFIDYQVNDEIEVYEEQEVKRKL